MAVLCWLCSELNLLGRLAHHLLKNLFHFLTLAVAGCCQMNLLVLVGLLMVALICCRLRVLLNLLALTLLLWLHALLLLSVVAFVVCSLAPVVV